MATSKRSWGQKKFNFSVSQFCPPHTPISEVVSKLSGPIRANRFVIRTRVANILRESILASKNYFLANWPSRKWIAARTGRESREFQCESERRRDPRESGEVLQKSFFFWLGQSSRANLRNVGVRTACPLSFQDMDQLLSLEVGSH